MITRGPLLSPSSRPHSACSAVVSRGLRSPTQFQPGSRTSPATRWRRSHVANSLKSELQDGVARVAAVCLAAVLACTSLPCSATSALANKPTFSADYAAVVRKREGKSKSNLPSSREAEALLEINEDLFTTEALEGMSRYISKLACLRLAANKVMAIFSVLQMAND